MNSRLYTGWVRHTRHRPQPHQFDYRVFQLYLDLGELPALFDRYWLWSAKRPAIAWFRRKDHLGDPSLSLEEAVRSCVSRKLGLRPAGPIRLLTHLRYFGYCMNPVSFYYCFDRAGAEVEHIVAEVHNTPWNERHSYVLDCREAERTDDGWVFRFRKDFHVSPFMPMDQDYEWRFSQPRDSLQVAMRTYEEGTQVFNAFTRLEAQPICSSSLAGALARYPFMTGQVVIGIYWQALRLRLKRTPFHAHPKRRQTTEVQQS